MKKEKIENEIAEKKEKVSNPELSKIIEAEIKNRGYMGTRNRLKRGWQTFYAIKRIQKKIKGSIKKFNSTIFENPTKTAGKLAGYVIIGLSGLIIMASLKVFPFFLPFILLIGVVVFLIVWVVETWKQKRRFPQKNKE